ncbi:rhodanese-like domain-containing protein [Xanthomarina spongicola]|jgi:rhodanese-related sulfurtransferase|uniref:Rhodanese-related sulfurtransferase n=1 Tax=Xanthomarina spongicola TaxID=570520 RepID=A0A316DJW9_9FLAO|nr:rhodanese-like domain-containing protein [Xanthomarina spongicola]PWK18514.1 rhodanese-related sulfurtransferase [Xanthomarina spongicola]
MRKILILFVIAASVFSVNAQEKDAIVLLTPTDFKSQTENKDIQLIDVRTPEEFQEIYIEEAINIDFYSEDFEVEFNKLDKDQPVYLYCRSGYRSNQSALKLVEMGFTEIYDLEGGILNYNKEK